MKSQLRELAKAYADGKLDRKEYCKQRTQLIDQIVAGKTKKNFWNHEWIQNLFHFNSLKVVGSLLMVILGGGILGNYIYVNFFQAGNELNWPFNFVASELSTESVSSGGVIKETNPAKRHLVPDNEGINAIHTFSPQEPQTPSEETPELTVSSAPTPTSPIAPFPKSATDEPTVSTELNQSLATSVRSDSESPPNLANEPVSEQPKTITTNNVLAFSSAEIDDLLKNCKKLFKSDQLTTGKDGNALACYQEILAKAPNNLEAQAGLKKIENRYVELADKRLKQRQFDKVENYLERLETVNPESPRLTQLKERLKQALETD